VGRLLRRVLRPRLDPPALRLGEAPDGEAGEGEGRQQDAQGKQQQVRAH
jgi:hypothetical protein